MTGKQLYTNIPVKETVEIIKTHLSENKFENEYRTQLIKIIKTILNQYYFQFNNKQYEQKDGIPMGSPNSGIMSEIFLQNMENEHIYNITRKHKIRLLARYIDNILLIYDSVTSNEIDILKDLISIFHKIKFTQGNEINNTINYLDLTITKNVQEKVIDSGIYHKPTSNTLAIHKSSRHPFQ